MAANGLMTLGVDGATILAESAGNMMAIVHYACSRIIPANGLMALAWADASKIGILLQLACLTPLMQLVQVADAHGILMIGAAAMAMALAGARLQEAGAIQQLLHHRIVTSTMATRQDALLLTAIGRLWIGLIAQLTILAIAGNIQPAALAMQAQNANGTLITGAAQGLTGAMERHKATARLTQFAGGGLSNGAETLTAGANRNATSLA